MSCMVDVELSFITKEVLVKACVDDQIVGHSDALWTHGVLFGIDELADDRIVKVCDFFVCRIVL